MDGDLWAARLAAAKRHHPPQHYQQHWDCLSIGDLEADDEMRLEFSCPYCYEDYDISALCSHLEEEHSYESKGVGCPICAAKVGKDMVGHITRQHGHLFKMQRRRRFRRTGMPPSSTLSLLGKELREAHLQVLLGGGTFRGSNTSLNFTGDSLLSALLYNLPIAEVEDPAKLVSYTEDNSRRSTQIIKQHRASMEAPLSAEEREQKLNQATLRAKFVQQLVVSTLTEDNLFAVWFARNLDQVIYYLEISTPCCCLYQMIKQAAFCRHEYGGLIKTYMQGGKYIFIYRYLFW